MDLIVGKKVKVLQELDGFVLINAHCSSCERICELLVEDSESSTAETLCND